MDLVWNTKCAVPGCKVPQSEVPGLKYHRFPEPKEESRRGAFLRFCLFENDPKGKLIICSAHFPDEAYQLSGRMLGRDRRDWRLNCDAVPTLFPPPGYVPEEVAEKEVEELTTEVDPIIDEDEEGIPDKLVPSHQCRLCLDVVNSDDPRSVNLFDVPTNGEDSLSGDLLKMFQLEMKPSPQWPSIACSKCVDFMHQIRRFKEQIMTSHRKLYKEIVQEAMNVQDMETEFKQGDLQEELPTVLNEVVSNLSENKAIDCLSRHPLRNEEELEKEMRTKGLLKCGECGKEEFQTLKDLNYHQKNDHKLHVSYIFCCDGKFNIYKGAYDHMEYHLNPEWFKCTPCVKQFLSGDLLEDHNKQTHPNRKFKKCRICGRILSNRSIKVHEATHLPIEQRPAKCGYCPKTFTSSCGLKQHVERMYEVEQRHVCEICGKKFSNGNTLRQHVANHNGKKKPIAKRTPIAKELSEEGQEMLNCLLCDESVQRAKMPAHWRMLHNKMFLECKLCRIQFKNYGNYQKHRDEHNNVVFKCDFCEKICNTRQGKYLHTKSHHLEEFQRRLENKKSKSDRRISAD